MSALARSRAIAAKASSYIAGSLYRHGMELQGKCLRCHLGFFPFPLFAGLPRVGQDCNPGDPGMVSLSISTRLPANSEAMLVTPVTLPPGRARLATMPAQRDHAMPINDWDIFDDFGSVGCAGPIENDITLRRTNSAARSGKRSNLPSAYRFSVMMFLPSTYPALRSVCSSASIWGAGTFARMPIRRIFPACWASTGTLSAKSKANKPEIRSRRSEIGFTTVANSAQRKRSV